MEALGEHHVREAVLARDLEELKWVYGRIGCDLSQAYELMQEDDAPELMQAVKSIHNDALMDSIFRLDGQEATRLVSFYRKISDELCRDVD